MYTPKFLAKCVKDIAIQGVSVGKVYCIEYEMGLKKICIETKLTVKIVFQEEDWFYEHFEPIRCISCSDREYCNNYHSGREYACYGFS